MNESRKQITIAILKPSLCIYPDRVKKVYEMIARKGLRPILKKSFVNWEREEVSRFYGVHQGKFFYPRLVFTMMNGPVEVIALEGVNAVAAWRTLLGPTHVAKARSEQPYSIRGQFAFSDTKNCVHGSDSEKTAMEELRFFFPDYQPTRELE